MRAILRAHIPLWLGLIIILVVAGGVAVLALISRQFIAGGEALLSEVTPPKARFQYGVRPQLANADFFNKVRNTFIIQRATFIEADLSSMKLRVYDNGAVSREVPILTKGKKGSWWETPSGIYQIESKERNHFSSFGQVYMPWSMQFQGNFFIHGWPSYPDGTPVSGTYSGGCIRLSTDDAKLVYDFVKVGTPVLVFEEDFSTDGFIYGEGPAGVGALSYLAADLKNNFVFAQKEGRSQLPIASLTKLVTAVVATEYINLDRSITITKDMLVPTSKPRLATVKKVTAYDLLFPLLMESSNEAAVALARFVGEKRFIELMNRNAASVGMASTTFADASGMNGGNISTAEDLFSLAKYLYHNRSFILGISSGKIQSSAYGSPAFKNLKNLNGFEGDQRFMGGKLGVSKEAKETMLAIFELELRASPRPVAIIVLGSDNAWRDVDALVNYIVNVYQ